MRTRAERDADAAAETRNLRESEKSTWTAAVPVPIYIAGGRRCPVKSCQRFYLGRERYEKHYRREHLAEPDDYSGPHDAAPVKSTD